MATVLITTTSDQALQALGTAGQTAAGSWSALRSTLSSRLGEAHAQLIAEPAVNPARGQTDWYADVSDPVRPLSTLDPPAQAAARETMARLVGEVQALAAELRDARDESQRFLGTMLELTTQIPDEGYVFVAGHQPILVAWGHAKAGAQVERVFLRGTRPVISAVPAGGRAASVPPMVILPPPASPFRTSAPSRLPLLAGLGLALALLMAASFLLWSDPFGWYAVEQQACAVAPGTLDLRAALDGAAAREGQLRMQLAQLTTEAGRKRLQCAPVQPPPRPPSRDVQRAAEAGGRSGKLHVILAWEDRNDLDLHIFCDGGHLFWRDRQSCGGNLDVDANGDARVAVSSPVENAFFTTPVPGRYRIVIEPYAMRVARSTDYRVTIQQEGKPDQVLTGTATLGGGPQEVATVVVEGTP